MIKIDPEYKPDTCFVCGKKFKDYNGVYATGWCSIACQFSRYDDFYCQHKYHPKLCVYCK